VREEPLVEFGEAGIGRALAGVGEEWNGKHHC
jgi:hypothetical protein